MNIDALKKQVERVKCEDSHLFFTRRFFLPRYGFKFSVNWHHVYMAWIVDEVVHGRIKNAVINVPPGAGKTEIMTNLVARGLALNPRSRFLYLSFSQSLVDDVSATARNIVKSEDFQNLWPVIIANDTDAKSNWKTQIEGMHAGHVYAASMGGQVTGRRAGTLNDGFTGAIILDDPLKPEDAFSLTTRDKANRKILNTVNSRKAKSDTPIIMIMQRLHEDDPTGFVMKGNLPGEWQLFSIPALIDQKYINTLPEHISKLVPVAERDSIGRQSYWPQKESLSSLLQLEQGGATKDGAQISRYTFNSQYMQQPTKLGGGLIQSHWFKRYNILPPLKWRAIWGDTAQKTKEHNDYSVLLVAGVSEDNCLYVVDIKRGKWEAPDLLEQTELFINKHRAVDRGLNNGVLRHLAIEDKASGTGLIQQIRRKNSIPVKAIQRNTDKLTRFMDVQAFIEQGRVFIPDAAQWVSEFLAECEAFKADMTHDHDDQIDTLIDSIAGTLIKAPMQINSDLLSKA